MKKSNTFGLAPFVIITFIYFIVGFLTTVNGQFQGPLQIAFLSEVVALRNTLITLIPFFFFLGYLLNSSLGGKWIDAHGYKGALIRAMVIMIASLATYWGSSYIATYYDCYGVSIGEDYIPIGYFIFLIGSFLMGTAAAILQVVINPYVASYELPNTQAVQRMSIVCAINSFGTTIAPFFVTGVMFAGAAMDSVSSEQLLLPFGVMTLFIAIITAITYRLNLPNIEGTFNSSSEKMERSIWSFKHLKLGVIAIFFYVGAEVAIGLNVNLHAMELISSGKHISFFGREDISIGDVELGIPALLATLYWGGLMVGRTLSSFISSVSARIQLVFTATTAIVLTFIAIFTNNLWVLISIGLCHSIMWGAIFTLAVKGLKEYTSKASGIFMMGVFGGAIFPLIQGFMADRLGSWQWTWSIVVICELVILYYALIGSKIRKGDNLEEK
ncbi:MAG: MFS transporter [Rikenellaceae bacterium]